MPHRTSFPLRFRHLAPAAALLWALGWNPSAARAHISLTYPGPRSASQKAGPCGEAGSTRGSAITVLEPGATITVRWDETIDHNAHYRIAFDADGEDDLVDVTADDDLYNSPGVLADGIADAVRGSYTQEVTLPDVECERCTLQLIQRMYGAGNYYQCADIALRRGAAATDGGTVTYDGGSALYDGGGTVAYDGGAGATDAAVANADGGSVTTGPPPSTIDRSMEGGCDIAAARTPGTSRPTPAWLLLAGAGLMLITGRRRPRSR